MAVQSVNLDTLSYETAKLMALFIGPNGTGKTIAACSGDGPVLINDFERRYLPLKKFYRDRKDITIRSYNYKTILTDFADDFENLIDYCPYRYVVNDSVTSMTTASIIAQMKLKGVDVKKTVKGKGFAVPSWDEFNGEAQFIAATLEVAKEIPANVIFTAHPIEKTFITEGEKAQRYTTIASFGHKVPQIIPGYFNEIWYFDNVTDLSGTKRQVTFQPTNSHPEAKTAFPMPGNIISDITDKRLLLEIEKMLSKENINFAQLDPTKQKQVQKLGAQNYGT